MEILKKAGVYKITCLVTGKFYIGSAINCFERKKQHLKALRYRIHKNRHLQNAYNVYGSDQFLFNAIEYLDDKNHCIHREQHYLDTLLFAQEYIQSKDKRFKKLGYNLSPTASSTLGVKYSDGAKAKIGAKHKGKRLSEAQKRGISERNSGAGNFMYGKTHSAEAKEKISNSKKGRKISEDHIESLRRSNLGRKRTKDCIGRISERHKKPVTALNLENGVFLDFLSIGEAAMDFKRPYTSVAYYVKNEIPFNNHLVFYK